MQEMLSYASIGISVLALIVSIVAISKSGSAAPAGAVAPQGRHKASPRPGAQLEAQLIKMPSDTEHGVISQDYRIWITNIGTGVAYNVNLGIDLDEQVLFQQEIDEKLLQDMQPGDRIELCTRIGLKTPKVFRVLTYWDTPEGQTVEMEHWVTRETN